MLQHERIKYYRKQAGLSIKTTADALGVSESCYKYWERGIYSPDLIDAPIFCELFNINPMQLLGWDNDTQIVKVKI